VDLAKVVAPPYDVITPEDQRRYYAQDPRNVVRLIAGDVKPSDHPGDNKYTRAAAFFAEWQREGVLRRESSPCLYLYRQTFQVPGEAEVKSRTGLLGVVKLQPFGEGVLAHERTHTRPKADRLSLTQAVDANLSPVFALYQDPEKMVAGLIEELSGGSPRFSIQTTDGEGHTVWDVRGSDLFRQLGAALEPSVLFIADGHHRYETALNYRNKQRIAHPEAPSEAAFNYVLMLLVDAADPNLLILPTHRVLRDLETFDPASMLASLSRRHRVVGRRNRRELMADLLQPSPTHRVGIALPGGRFALLEMERGTQEDPVLGLDVTVLHGEVFERELDLHEGLLEAERHVGYSRDPDRVMDQVEQGRAQAGFLLRPPAVSDVIRVAQAGEVMPQKSTYFFPKPLSGLVFNPLDPQIRIGPA
jgi:uncharacterized protein (DUF1015 family)